MLNFVKLLHFSLHSAAKRFRIFEHVLTCKTEWKWLSIFDARKAAQSYVQMKARCAMWYFESCIAIKSFSFSFTRAKINHFLLWWVHISQWSHLEQLNYVLHVLYLTLNLRISVGFTNQWKIFFVSKSVLSICFSCTNSV